MRFSIRTKEFLVLLLLLTLLAVSTWWLGRHFDRFRSDVTPILSYDFDQGVPRDKNWQITFPSTHISLRIAPEDGRHSTALRLDSTPGTERMVRIHVPDVHTHQGYHASLCLKASRMTAGLETPYGGQVGFVFSDTEGMPMRARPHILTLITQNFDWTCLSARFVTPKLVSDAAFEVILMGGEGQVVVDDVVVEGLRENALYPWLHRILLGLWILFGLLLAVWVVKIFGMLGLLALLPLGIGAASVLMPKHWLIDSIRPFLSAFDKAWFSLIGRHPLDAVPVGIRNHLPVNVLNLLSGSPPLTPDEVMDVGHLVLFFFLALITGMLIWRRWRWRLLPWALGGLLLMGLAMLGELMQLMTSSRGFSTGDILINLIGVACGLLFAFLLGLIVALFGRKQRHPWL